MRPYPPDTHPPASYGMLRGMRWASTWVMLTLGMGCSSAEQPGTKARELTWTEATACPQARFEANGIVVGDELWVMGGFIAASLDVTKRVDIYNPANDSWRQGPDLPDAETHVAVVNADGDLLLVGGFQRNVLERMTTAGVWRLDPATATWSAGPDLPSPRAAVAAALVGSELHIAGGLAADGNTDTGDHLVWDIAGSDGWQSAEPLPNPRNHGGGAQSGGLFFAVAGRHGWNEKTGDDPQVDAFDPKTGAWSARAPMPVSRSEIGAATVAMADGRLLVVGGSITGQHPSDDVLVYDPHVDQWSELPPLPEPRKGVVAARIGDKLIVTSGSPTSIDPSPTTWVGCCL